VNDPCGQIKSCAGAVKQISFATFLLWLKSGYIAAVKQRRIVSVVRDMATGQNILVCWKAFEIIYGH
jgi:hypothetical protein